jgi:WD40 repeat protein
MRQYGGSGKSSLVRAGIVPEVTRPGAVRDVDLWRVAVVVPGLDTIGSVATRLYAQDADLDGTSALPELLGSPHTTPDTWKRLAASNPNAAAATVAWAISQAAATEQVRVASDRPLVARLLLVVDQLEYLLGAPDEKAFVALLGELLATERVWLVLTMRSDSYAKLLENPPLIELKMRGASFDLPLPGSAEIADIVHGPARAAGLELEETENRWLADELARATPSGDALPLLQMTLAQLFEKRDGVRMTLRVLDEIGGMDGAIASHADKIFGRLSRSVQAELPHVIEGLVRDVARQPDGQVVFTARASPYPATTKNRPRDELVNNFVDNFLFVRGAEGGIRIAHDALLRQWAPGRASIAALADFRIRQARKEARRQILAVVVITILFIGAVWSVWSTYSGGRLATSERLAEKATNQIDVDDDLALLLGLSAVPHPIKIAGMPVPWPIVRLLNPYSPEAVRAVIQSSFKLHKDKMSGHLAFPIRLHHRPAACSVVLSDIVFSPPEKSAHIAFACSNGTILYDTPGSKLQRFNAQPLVISSMALSRDGSLIALGSSDGTVQLLDVRRGHIARFEGRGGRVSSVAIDANGEYLASASDSFVRVWATGASDASGRLPDSQYILKNAAQITAITFSEGGGEIIAADIDGAIHRWIWSEKKEVAGQGKERSEKAEVASQGKQRNSKSPVSFLKSTTGGTCLLSIQEDRSAVVWSDDVQLSHSQTRSEDRSPAKRLPDLIDAAKGEGEIGKVEKPIGVGVASDGRGFIVLYSDGETVNWISPGCAAAKVVDGASGFWDYALSPDERHFAWISKQGPLHVIDLVTGEEVALPLELGTDSPKVVQYSADGNKLAVASRSNVWLWNVRDRHEIILEPPSKKSTVRQVFFIDETLRMISKENWIDWDSSTGKILADTKETEELSLFSVRPILVRPPFILDLDGYLGRYGNPMSTVTAWSGDRNRTASYEYNDIDIKEERWFSESKSIATLQVGDIIDMELNYDGTRLMTVSDSQVRLWDVESRLELARLYGQPRSARMSPGGKFLAIKTRGAKIVIRDADGYGLTNDFKLFELARSLTPGCLERNQKKRLRELGVALPFYQDYDGLLCKPDVPNVDRLRYQLSD